MKNKAILFFGIKINMTDVLVHRRKAFLNKITMATVIILSHKAQYILTVYGDHTMASYNRTHVYKHTGPKIPYQSQTITCNQATTNLSYQQLLIMQRDYVSEVRASKG
jgi:hypothetical protein